MCKYLEGEVHVDYVLKKTYPKIKNEVVEKIDNILCENNGRSAIHNKLVEHFGKQGLEYYKILRKHI